MGGKSSSSADSTNTTTTTTGSSTGNLGTVVQGTSVTINQNVPDQVVEVFNQLIGLAGKSLDLSSKAGQAAIDATTAFGSKAVQPDLSIVESGQKQNYYVIGGAVLLLGIFLWKI